MKKSRKDMRKNVMQRVPKEVRKLVEVAIENNPAVISDLDKIIRTHSCRPERTLELMDHIAALVASEQPGMDRPYLRQQAFGTAVIDNGEKGVRHNKILELKAGKSCWEFTMDDGMSALAEFATDGYDPQVGSELWLFTVNFSFVLGLIIDGHVFRYQTIAQDRAEREAWKERRRAEERKKLPEHDAAIAKLPEIFQQRIKNFQRAPMFREDLEAYEIFVCEQAVLFAERLKTVRKLILWSKLSYEHQVQFLPQLKDAGHSGNTFGAACCLARLYLETPEMVTQMPGALSPLVGSDAYLPLEERMAESA